MLPFGETLLAWRLARGMSQAELAQAARMSRPNLSAVERGDREVTLRTLRRLALALDVRPGILADGVAPAASAAGAIAPTSCSRRPRRPRSWAAWSTAWPGRARVIDDAAPDRSIPGH